MIRFLKSLNEIASIRTWAMFLAGPPMLLFAGWLVWIVWHGGWPPAQAARQLDILGKALWITLALLAVIIVSLAAAKVRGTGLGGTSFEIESGNNEGRDPPSAPAAEVTTTTKTEIKKS